MPIKDYIFIVAIFLASVQFLELCNQAYNDVSSDQVRPELITNLIIEFKIGFEDNASMLSWSLVAIANFRFPLIFGAPFARLMDSLEVIFINIRLVISNDAVG